MATLLKSKLVFIDSDFSVNGNGDDFALDFHPTAIQAGERQFVRMTLQEFHGYKNWYNINSTNNTLMLNIDGAGFATVSIDPNNYETYNDIANNLADKLVAALTAAGLTYTKGAILPQANKIPASTGNRKLSITLANGATAASSFVLQAREISGYSDANNYNDSFAVLGGKRVTTAADTSSSSFGVSIDGSSGNITITGFYPMQRSTSEHIYLRTSLVNDNLGTKSMHSLGNHNETMSGTNIFAKIPVHSEFVAYSESSSQGTGYFVDLSVRNLTHATFSLTDAKSRRLPQVDTEQNTKGNMNYTFVIRVDIFAMGSGARPNELLLPEVPPPRQNAEEYLITGKADRGRIKF